jgi:hypothetical protein
MRRLLRYFLIGRPFRHLSTTGAQLLTVGNGLALASGVARTVWLGWPSGVVGWLVWALPFGALALLALVVQAAAREYYRRPDRPRHLWHITLSPAS